MFSMRCIPLPFYTECLCQVKLPQWHHTNTWLTVWITLPLITFTGVLSLNKPENWTFCIFSASADNNDDSFTTLDEPGVISGAVIHQVIAINKAVRHHDRDLIVPFINHCMGVKGRIWRGKINWLRQLKACFSFILMCLCKKYLKTPLNIWSMFSIFAIRIRQISYFALRLDISLTN